MTAEKLINQYQDKIKSIDTVLGKLQTTIVHNRIYCLDNAELLEERKQLNDKRQIYYQFIKDLEDL